MNSCIALRCATLAGLCMCVQLPPGLAAESTAFREVLALANLDPNAWPEFDDQQLDEPAQELIRQLLFRLGEFSQQQLTGWADSKLDASKRGDLISVTGSIDEVVPLHISSATSSDASAERLYRCRYRSDGSDRTGFVITPRLPSHWNDRTVSNEPVRFVGIVLRPVGSEVESPLLLTNHLSWYPTTGTSSGMLLLAEQGMDVSLLDEVRHRQPFVKSTVSREGDAFYACLAAISALDQRKLARLTLENVQTGAERWASEIPELETELKRLKADRNTPKQQIKSTGQKLAMASAVQERAERQVSSVAPLFLQPQRETGQLVRIEGVARRAVRIVADRENLEAYYEMEVFSSDSQNLPIVCCVTSLPPQFPEGDKIRESVRVDGVFFKSWRFRTRKSNGDDGETNRPQQLYTPVIVGREPVWLKADAEPTNTWAIAAGICFVAVMVGAFVKLLLNLQAERRRRASLTPTELPGRLADTSADNESHGLR